MERGTRYLPRGCSLGRKVAEPGGLRCDSGFVIFVFNEGLGMETMNKLYNMRVDWGQLGSTGLKDEDLFLLIS